MLEEGISALVSSSRCTSMHYMESQASAFHLPHLAVHPWHCRLVHDDRSTLSMYPSPDWLVELVKDISLHQKWLRIAIFYDDSLGKKMQKCQLFYNMLIFLKFYGVNYFCLHYQELLYFHKFEYNFYILCMPT